MEPSPKVEAPASESKDAGHHEEVGIPVDGTDYSEKSAQKAKFSHYTRVFTYTTLSDRILLSLAFVGQIGYVVHLYLLKYIYFYSSKSAKCESKLLISFLYQL